MDKKRRQLLDDQFDAFTMLAGGNYVSIYDVNEKVTRFSPGAVELFGLEGEYVENGADKWMELIHPEDRKAYQSSMEKLVSCRTLTYDVNYRVKIGDGNYGLFRFKGAVIRDDGDKAGFIGGVISNEGLVEYTDAVTTLRNRTGFFNDLAAMQAMHQESVILMIGINHMTEINSEYGYGYGNKILQQIGWIVQECTGFDGIVYRMDGSKFAVLSQSPDVSDMEDIYNRIRLKLKSGVEVEGVKKNITSAGGLMIVEDFDVDERAVFTCLNYAYKESKNRRHGALVLFNGSMTEDSQKRLYTINEIRKCMVNDCENFYVEYQPVIELKTNKAIGVEALVRFKSKDTGEVKPFEFIPVLEHDFAFEEMGIWIMNKAMTDGMKLLEKKPDFVLGLNIAASQLEDAFFVDTLKNISKITGFPLTNLSLELSKDCRLIDWKLLKDKVCALRDLGVRILLDDFGSGYASLETLKNIPVDLIKFDMQFVREMKDNDIAVEDMKRLAELAAIHDVATCVKGIETEEVLNVIKGLSVRSGQGFLFERPADIEYIIEKYI